MTDSVTIHARRCLTAVIGWKMVHSMRKRGWHANDTVVRMMSSLLLTFIKLIGRGLRGEIHHIHVYLIVATYRYGRKWYLPDVLLRSFLSEDDSLLVPRNEERLSVHTAEDEDH